ncbi:MAG: cell division protein FtsL [Deltaproteobacteria bacterium RBG_16_47_11]|nr:MAG: cell division protein FtsL [Deltaproteobacteria bacterium RBG_16_47_11]
MTKTVNKSEDRILWTGEDSKSKPKRMKLRFVLLFTVIMLFFIGGSLFYVWSRIQVIQLGYQISNALKEERALTETNKKLRLEIATLKSYARIEKLAVEELRMAKPKPEQVIVIR